MKKLLYIICALLISNCAIAQVTLIGGATANGNFEAGATGWTLANGATNAWEIGTTSFNGGARGAYIRKATGGSNNTYTNNVSQKSYLFSSTPLVNIPATATCATLTFWYKGRGENNKDFLSIYLGATVPTAGNNPPAGATRIGATQYNLTPSSGATWVQATIEIPVALYGTAQYLMFYWQNDGSGGSNPPASVDDVVLTYFPLGNNNDDCAGATPLPVGTFGTCTTTNGDIKCAGNSSITAISGTADDDLWYSFVATASTHIVNIGATTINPVIEAFSGSCGALTSIANTNSNSLNVSGLTVGLTYYIRVFSFASVKPIPGTFNICITTPLFCPANLGADYTIIPSLPYNITGQTTCGKGNDLTASNVVSCGNNNFFSGEDVVYSFIPTTSGYVSVTLTSSGSNTGLMLYEGCPFSGTCQSFIQNSTGNKSIGCTPVTAGVTYYIVIDSNGPPSCNPFDLDVSAPFTSGLANDDVCGAIMIPINTSCVYSTYDLTGACGSLNPPPTCGTYNGQDVWFKFTVPVNGTYEIDTKEGTMVDALMAVYRGATCGGALTLIGCDDNSSTNGLMPFLANGPLIAGETIYIRIMPNGTALPGTFEMCVRNPCANGPSLNDNPCGASAIAVGGTAYGDNSCSTDGRGTTEPASSFGTATLGIYNSLWYKFVAPTGGSVQIRTVLGSLRNTIMGVYSGTCGTGLLEIFTNDDISLCTNAGSNKNSGITATGLTAGQTYYIMIDGESNSVGDFTVSIINGASASSWPLIRGSDCGAAKDVCDDSTTVSNPGFQAFGNYCDFDGNNNCISDGEKNSAWFNLDIVAAGNLAFDIVPNDFKAINPFTGQINPGYSSTSDETDYDFAIWKVTGGAGAAGITSTCAAIAATASLAPDRCNYSSLGVTGLNATGNSPTPAYTGFDDAYESQLPAAVGDRFLLVINNFGNSVNGFTLHFTGTTGISGINYTAGTVTNVVTWTGGNSTTSWTNIDNWGGCAVPTCAKDAFIDPLYIQPTITAAMGIVTVRDLNIGVGASLTLAAGARLQVCGNVNNLGDLICHPTSTIIFNDEVITHTFNGNFTDGNALGNIIITDPNSVNGAPNNCRVTITSDMDIKGSFTTSNNGSVFDQASKYIKLAGNFTNASGNATFTNSNSGSATLEFNGSTTQNFLSLGTLALNNVIINQSVTSNVNILVGGANRLIVSPSGTLTLLNGKITFANPPGQEVLVQNPAATAVSTGNVNSYVEGRLRRHFTTTSLGSYDFPVGNLSKGFQRLNINYPAATGAAVDFSLTTNFNNWDAVSPFPLPSPLGLTECTVVYNNPWLDNGNWTVNTFDQTVAGGVAGAIAVPGLYNLTLYNRSFTNNGGSNGWTIAKSPSGAPAWVMDGICQATPINSVRRNGMSGFSRFGTVQSSAVPLPIELFSFETNAELTYNVIDWITATETNNDYFEIEACEDGINFKPIEKRKGAGNSNKKITYTTRDKNYSPTTYYRLKQVDFDGKTSYSEIRVVSRFNKKSKDLFTVDVAPNPTDSEIHIKVTSGAKETYRVDVMSIDGKLLLKRDIDEKDFYNGVTLDFSSLENGMYHVEVSSSKGYVIKKVIKNN
jgi:hypothetical protein